ncbi:MAG: PBP1A family penicillin-binding protein [Caldilineae bacterium]|nr:MAG: PBP1A family penicillin-binding protein [Caldilineae bacterium]
MLADFPPFHLPRSMKTKPLQAHLSFLGRRVARLLTVLVVGVLAASSPVAASHQGLGRKTEPGVSAATAAAIDRLAEVAGKPLVQTTRIYDRHGNVIYEIVDEGRRTIVPLQVIPRHLIEATIATEDKNFFEHAGVDWLAVARAAFQNLQAERIVSGASTITQQVVDALLLKEDERYRLTLERKMREAALAVQLEERYSKEEILEMYLNSVYYGHRAYGVAAAARTYFGKDVSELTLAESALLAGLPQSPVNLDPLVHPDAARERQKIVLNLMERAHFITPEEKAAALAQPLHFVRPEFPVMRAPHFVDYVRELLLERYGPEKMRQGLHVYTSIDLRYQAMARDIARAQIDAIGAQKNASNAAVVIMQPQTGEILAMVGSIDYWDDAIDGQVNMTVARRQPGSAIKPIVYAAAFDRGWQPASVIWDTPTTFRLSNGRLYTPTNIDFRYYGPVRLRTALANSLNVSSVKLLAEVGIDNVLKTARSMGIRSWRNPPDRYGLSLAVGGYEVTLLELTHAFATLANRGAFVREHAVTRITDGAGRVLYQMKAETPVYAVSPAAAYQVSDVLSDYRARRLVFGRSTPLNTSRIAAAKTGTTTNWRDNLTVGYTPYVAVGVWVGNTDGYPMRKALGSSTAAPIWHDIMETIWATPALWDALGYAGRDLPEGFASPPDIQRVPTCDLRPNTSSPCPLVYEEVLRMDGPETAGRSAPVPALDRRRKGYCLPTPPGDVPEPLRQLVSFIPLPTERNDMLAASRWARDHGLTLVRNGRCEEEPQRRKLAAKPKPPPAQRLIESTEPAQKVAVEQAGVELAPGSRATLRDTVSEAPLWARPGGKGTRMGSARPGHVLAIRQGPRKARGATWFEVRDLDIGVIGWVNAEYLMPQNPQAGMLIAAIETLQIGGKATLSDAIDALYVRAKPGARAGIVGFIRPGDALILQSGPQTTDGVPWYEVVVEGKNVQGWVDGRYLQAGTY